MLYVLMVAVLNIYTGEITRLEPISDGLEEEACVEMLMNNPPEHPLDDEIKVYNCVPQALLNEAST